MPFDHNAVESSLEARSSLEVPEIPINKNTPLLGEGGRSRRAFSAADREAGMATAAARRQECADSRVTLPGGWMVWKDHLPGVGWILAPPSTDDEGVTTPGTGHPRRYHATKDECLARYRQLVGP